MTTYKTTTYETTEALHNAIRADLDQLAYPYEVKHRTYGEGQLTSVKVPSNLSCSSLYAVIDFGTETKVIALDVAFAIKVLTLPEILTDVLVEAQTAFKADFETRQAEQRVAWRRAREEAEAAAQKAAEEKKAQEKYEKAKAKALKDFDTLANAYRPAEITNEFYYSLGWLAKNAGAFSAAMPDYLLSSFESHFGTDYKPTVVDSKKKTINGNPMQWALSMRAAISKKALDLVPSYLTKYLSTSRNAITDTDFIWDLVDNYGFKLGKKQDVEKIRSHVPANCIASFEAGLA